MTRGVAENAVSAGWSWAVPTLVAFVAIPVLVRGLGADAYGVVVLVGATAGYMAVLDLGLANGVIRYLSVFAAAGHGRAARECILLTVAWAAGVGVLGAGVIWLSAPWLVHTLVKIPGFMSDTAVSAFRVGGMTFVVSMVASVLSLIPQGLLRYDISAWLGGALSVVITGGPALVVAAGYGLLHVMWFGFGAGLIAAIVWGVAGALLLSAIPADGPPFGEYWQEFKEFSLASAANRVWSTVAQQTSRLVVGVAGGSAQVAYFQVPSQIAQYLNQLLNKVSTVLLPAGTRLVMNGDHSAVERLYERSSRLFFLVNVAGSGAVIAFSRPLLLHWIGSEYAATGALALGILTFTQVVNAATMSASNLNLAFGRPWVNLRFAILNSIISMVLVYPLTLNLGIMGTALAGLAGAATVPAFMIYTHRRVLQVASWPIMRDCYLKSALSALVVSTASFLLLAKLATSLWWTLLLIGVTALLNLAGAVLLGAVSSAEWTIIRRALLPQLSGDRKASIKDGPNADDQ